MSLTQESMKHSSPLKSISKYDELIDRLCDGFSNFQPIPRAIREGAKRITRLVQAYFPTRGRRRIAIAIVAIGIARGNRDINYIKDLVYRANILCGQEVPWGQIQNTFEDLQAFLANLNLYKERYKERRKIAAFRYTPEERKILRILRSLKRE